MSEQILTSFAIIAALGGGAQWLAWRLGLPSILILLPFGFAAGAVGWVDPDQLMGDLLLPLVSVSVALILYEGGLTLKISELREAGRVVTNLVTVGMVITWAAAAIGAHLIFDLSLSLSILLGAILVVTGPTVIGPLLRHIRPAGAVGPVLKWEGIVIDPIGALLAVLVFEVIVIGDAGAAMPQVIKGLVKTIFAGGGLGLAAAWGLTFLLRRFLIPDFLQNAVSLVLVVGVFVLTNHIQHEAGLLAVTVMGFALANQKQTDIAHIVEFKENLRVLLISALFILLAARLKPSDLTEVLLPGLLFVGVLILVARPLSVLASTVGTSLKRNARMMIAGMAPRGIVAAAVTSVFALRLEEVGIEQADRLVPITFVVIMGTVALYGLFSPLLARRLGVGDMNPQGIIFVGAHPWVRDLAMLIQKRGIRVLVADTNYENAAAARMAGIPTYGDSILGDHALDEIDLSGLGKLMAVTPNDWINILSIQRFSHLFGRANCYQITPSADARKRRGRYKHLQGRLLFQEDATYASISRRYAKGARAKATPLTEAFSYQKFLEHYDGEVLPFFLLTDEKKLRVFTPGGDIEPKQGDVVFSFVIDRDEEEKAATASAVAASANPSSESIKPAVK